MLRLGAGVHEGLSDDVQRGVHHLRHVDVEDEVGVPQDVHPEPHRQAEDTQRSAAKNHDSGALLRPQAGLWLVWTNESLTDSNVQL